MEDVIFAGTSARPPRDFAEVVLHAEDDAGEELVVTRRIERGSGSAYRVNGRDVRAKDVSLVFADAATGAAQQVAALAQYVKDLSVENPSAPQVYQWQEQPQLDVQFNIQVNKIADDVHEVVLKIELAAKSDQGAHFLVDLSYAYRIDAFDATGRSGDDGQPGWHFQLSLGGR